MKILVLNGPNLNMLGIREPEIYGKQTYQDLVDLISGWCKENGVEAGFYQSNHEGALIDRIQEAYGKTDGIVFNPGGYTMTSIALLDALKAVGIPTVEVHISDMAARESFRQHSYIAQACLSVISGRGFQGYIDAIQLLLDHQKQEKK